MREWVVAGAVVERDGNLLLVHNQRADGAHDWSTPGGVVDDSDESVVHGLAREVREETGLVVAGWDGPLYEVTATAVELGWRMRCEVYRAVACEGELAIDDPDGIVVDAAFVSRDLVENRLAGSIAWVREPLIEWLALRWGPGALRSYHYRVTGARRSDMRVERAFLGG